MIKKKFSKLIGLQKEDFDSFIDSGQIHAQPARLIPTLKTGDEMAMTSIFLSAVKLIKEYRTEIFRELRLSRSGTAHYYTEVCFSDIDKSRVDGLIVIVIKGIIKEAVFFEMKNKSNGIDKAQVERYISLSKKLGVKTLATVSNEFVADSSHSPVNVRVPKHVSLHHFSWTYLMTKGQLLLFKNEHNIKDEDQVEIMREVLYYQESPVSGVSGYISMKAGWKELVEAVRAQKALKMTDSYIEDAVVSWHQEEKDMALLMSRKLGVLVKSTSKSKESLKDDIKRLVKENFLTGNLSVKNSVSDIKIIAEFERRTVSMSVKVAPPLDKGTVGKISWMNRQLENCKKRNPVVFAGMEADIWIEADVKYAKANLKVRLSQLDELIDECKGKEIQAFLIVLINGFGASFGSNKKFIVLIEKMVLDYYAGIVQHLTNWNSPAPKL
ncbi:hypothetical protein JYT74_03005 [Crocinitomix catalasitica]|nr:hypothetical protein [Crocinitomix catalasitica]